MEFLRLIVKTDSVGTILNVVSPSEGSLHQYGVTLSSLQKAAVLDHWINAPDLKCWDLRSSMVLTDGNWAFFFQFAIGSADSGQLVDIMA